MSADDFQIKYASVMESMLKSAVAETTKLFETMVDELKAEISRIKKENEDLKTRCSQFENAKSQPAVHSGGSAPLPGTSDAFEKRDTAIQCDLVPIRTMLVEQCQPFRDSSLQNQEQQWRYEKIEYSLPEYNYVIHREAESQMANVEVKQEDDDSCLQSVLKQEQDEPTMTCRQVVNDNAGSSLTFTCGTEGPCINQKCLSGEIPLPQKNEETTKALDLLCLRMESSLQGVQNRSSEPQHSLVISLAAIKDDLEEESEISLKTSEIGTQAELKTSDEHQLIVAQHQSEVESLENEQPRDISEKEISVNEQADITLEQNGNVHCTVEQLTETTARNKEVTNEQLKSGMAEDEPSSQPVRRKRGRPPKRAKNLQQRVRKDLQLSSTVVTKEHEMVTSLITVEEVEVSSTDTVNATAFESPNTSQINSKKTSSIIAPSAQESLNTALKDVDNRKVVSVVPLSRKGSSEKGDLSESQHHFTEMEKASNQAPSNEVSFATETLNTPPAGSPQAPAHHHKQCRTSVTLQDAMLLVEAMNQSTVENAFNSPKKVAAPPQSQRASFVRTLQTVDEIPAKPQKPRLPVVVHEVTGKLPVTEVSTSTQSTMDTLNVTAQSTDAAPNDKDQTHRTVVISSQQHVVTHPSTTASPAPLSSAAVQTSVSSMITSLASSKQSNAAPQKITVVPRSTSSLMPHKIATLSPSQFVAAQNTSLLPGSTAVSCGSSVLQNTIYVTSGKLLPVVPSQSGVTSRDQQSGTLAQPKIIIIPRQPQSPTILLATKQDSAKSDSPVIVASPQLCSTSQDLRASLDAQATLDEVASSLSQKRDNISDDLKSPKQTMSVPEITNAPTGNSSSLKRSVGQVPASVFPVVQPAPEQKLSAMVRLTRLPLPVSTTESVFVSRLLSNGSLNETRSTLKDCTTQRKPSSMIILTQPSEMPVTNIRPNLNESSVALCVNNSQMFEEQNVQNKALAFSETSTVMEKSQESSYVQPSTSYKMSAVATSTTEPLADEALSNLNEQIISNTVQNCALQNDPTIGENQAASPIQLTAITPKDTTDPHLQMTKTQFLAQLAVSPIVQAPEKASTGDFADATVCGKKRFQMNSLVVRLRSHLKTHCQTKRAESNPEQCIETEITTVSPEKRKLENDNPKDKNTSEPIPVSAKSQIVLEDVPSVNETTNDFGPISPRKSDNEPTTVSSRKSNVAGESPPVRRSSGRDGGGSKNKQPSSVSPRRSSSTKDGTSPINTKSPYVISMKTSTSRDGASTRNTKSTSVSTKSSTNEGAVPKDTISVCVSPKRTITSGAVTTPNSTKSTCMSPKTTNTSRSGTSPKNKKSTFVTEEDKTSRDGVSPPKNKSTSDSPRMDRRSALTKSGTKQIKRESNYLSPGKCGVTTDGASTKKAKCETASPRAGLAKSGGSPKRTGKSTPAKKPRLSQDGTGPKKNLKVVNAKKLANAAKAKTITKMKISKQLLKLQNGAKTSQLAENQANCEVVKKCTTKAVWIPPRIPVTKTPTKETRSIDHAAIYTPSVSFHPILVKGPPIVSPLQPLSVIGGRLLKNQCGECGRILSSSAALESHVGLHTGRRPFSCTLCGKSFPDSKGLKRHGRVHRNGRIHVCPQCGKGFVYRFGLTKHLQMVHGRLKPFVCQICNKGFYAKRDVEAHIRIHTGEKPFHCNLCEKKFTRRVELNVHLRWHNGEKRHWCPFCGKGFLDFNNLKRHKYIHTGEKPHSCPHCPKNFTQSGHLKKHVKNVHKIQ